MGKITEKEFEIGLKSHYLADSPIEINEESQKKLENIDNQLLIALAGKNLQDFILVTCREKAIQTELRRRKRALPPFFVKGIVNEFYSHIIEDKDLCNVEDFKKWYEQQGGK